MIDKNRKEIGWFRKTNTIPHVLGRWYFRKGYVYSCSRRVLSSKFSRLYALPSLEGTRKNLFRFPFLVLTNPPAEETGSVTLSVARWARRIGSRQRKINEVCIRNKNLYEKRRSSSFLLFRFYWIVPREISFLE